MHPERSSTCTLNQQPPKLGRFLQHGLEATSPMFQEILDSTSPSRRTLLPLRTLLGPRSTYRMEMCLQPPSLDSIGEEFWGTEQGRATSSTTELAEFPLFPPPRSSTKPQSMEDLRRLLLGPRRLRAASTTSAWTLPGSLGSTLR